MTEQEIVKMIAVAFEMGRGEGFEKGRSEGYSAGYSEGYCEAYDKGYDNGEEDAKIALEEIDDEEDCEEGSVTFEKGRDAGFNEEGYELGRVLQHELQRIGIL